MNNATNVITHFLGLLTLKRQPENLNYSINTLLVLFFGFILSIKFSAYSADLPSNFAKLKTIFPIMIIAYEITFLAILYGLLAKVNKQNRFVQTAANFIGINIISAIVIVIINLLPLKLLWLCLIKSWLLLINFHITKHAFNLSHIQAVWTYILINLLATLVVSFIFILMFRLIA